MKAQGITCFNRNSWMEMSGTDREKTRDACDYMVSHNMIRNLYSRRGSALYVFTDHHFSIHEGAIVCGMQDSGFTFHAVNFAERGILTTERSPGQPNSFAFAITPKRNPEFFALEKPESAYHSSASASATAAPVPLAAASG